MLANSRTERERYENMAELYSIIQTLEHLEKAYVRDAVAPQKYDSLCRALISKYKTLQPALGDDVLSLSQFTDTYKLQASAANHRLNTGLTAIGEHGSGAQPTGNNSRVQVPACCVHLSWKRPRTCGAEGGRMPRACAMEAADVHIYSEGVQSNGVSA